LRFLSSSNFSRNRKEKEKEKSEVSLDFANSAGIPIFNDPLGGGGVGGQGQVSNDINNAIKTLQKPLSHSKVHFGSTKKEYIFQTAITSNNPELASQVSLGLGGPMQLAGATPALNYDLKNQNESKKTEKTPKPTIFSSKTIKTDKSAAPEKLNSEDFKKSKKIEKKDISTPVLSLSKKGMISAKFAADKKPKKSHPQHSHIQINKAEKEYVF